MNRLLIKLEGFTVGALGIYLYFSNGFSWILFLLLLFVPDISMAGYAINEKIGAYVYNAFHTYSTPLLLVLLGAFLSIDALLMVSFIWLVHIGIDRMLGYGLKYETGFKDTHIQRL